jgi:hypothetical protein
MDPKQGLIGEELAKFEGEITCLEYIEGTLYAASRDCSIQAVSQAVSPANASPIR